MGVDGGCLVLALTVGVGDGRWRWVFALGICCECFRWLLVVVENNLVIR